jgi:heme/copper-type cytochrome/quinol oxidase subunit 2
MPELVIVIGVIFIHIALVLYSIFIYKERKYRRATNGVVGFITAAVIFDVSATICMMLGTVEGWLTLHGVLGYTALTVMVIDAIFIWKHRNNHGTEVPFSDALNRNTKLGYILWLVAFGTGEMLAVINHY